TTDLTRWYDDHRRAQVSFRKSPHFSDGRARPEIFFRLPAFARGGGRENQRLSPPNSSLSGGDRNATSRSDCYFQRHLGRRRHPEPRRHASPARTEGPHDRSIIT